MARTNDVWETFNDGTGIKTTKDTGYDLLINGSNHYINFNTVQGAFGYGIRDNGGVMEFKNSGGAWVGLGGGGSISGSPYSVVYFNAAGNGLDSFNGYFDYDPNETRLTLNADIFSTELGALRLGAYSGNTLVSFTNYSYALNDTQYMITGVPLSTGFSAGIGSWAGDGQYFWIKDGPATTDWKVPLLMNTSTHLVEAPTGQFGSGYGIYFNTPNDFFQAGDVNNTGAGLQLYIDNFGTGQIVFGNLGALVNGTTFRLDDYIGKIIFAYGTTTPIDTTLFTSTLIDTDTDILANHYRGKTGTPTYSAGTGAGTGPTISITGNDFSHYFTIRAGTSPIAGAVIATITLDQAFTGTPRPVFSDCGSTLTTDAYIVGTTASTYDIVARTALGAGKQYDFNIIVVE